MSDLIKYEEVNQLKVFVPNGLDPVIEKVEQAIRDFKSDTSTANGRDEIRSFAVKIRTTKTTIEKAGKALVENQKKQIAIVDKERIRAVNRLDELQKEARDPLTQYELKEKKRIENHQVRLDKIRNMRSDVLNNEYDSNHLKDYLLTIDYIEINDSWEEFKDEAAFLKEDVRNFIEKKYEAKKKHEEDQIELERLKKENEERIERERIAEEKRLEQERIEREKKEKEERKKKDEEDRKKREEELKQKAIEDERKKHEAEKQKLLREKEENERKLKEAEEKRKQEKKDAEKRQREAIENERRKQAEEKRKEEEAEKKRQADIEYRRKINNEICAAFEKQEFDNDEAQKIVSAIARGEIPYIKIMY